MAPFYKGQNIHGIVLLEPTYVRTKGKNIPAWICQIRGETIRVITVKNLHRRKFRKPRTPPFQASVNQIFNSYRYRCKLKNIFFDLTVEEFFAISQKNCVYCGATPANRESVRGFIYNGLDRKDNRKGYTRANSLPCCGLCNSLKSNILTYEEMVAAMKAILSVRAERGSRRSKKRISRRS